MIVQICAETDPGLARTHNEDAVAFEAESGLGILADGMGGHNAGEVASGMAAAFLKSELSQAIARAGKEARTEDLQQTVVHAINQANGAIYTMSHTNPHYAGMGTTLVISVFYQDSLVLAHIGDSRCYRLREQRIERLTRDHSVLQEQVDDGLVIADQTTPRMGHNLVTRALGVEEQVRPDVACHPLQINDIYLMCSDGLTDMVSDDTICAILKGEETLAQRAKQLVAAANHGGGRDNISVLLAQVEEAPKPGLLGSARRMLQGVWPGSKGR